MYALATCQASLLRGSTTNDYLDEVDEGDEGVVVATGLLCAIHETASRVYDLVDGAPRVVRVVRAQLQSDVDVRPDDRLRDDTHSVTYAIDNITRPDAVGMVGDTVLELKRVT